uniref:Secreted protein n=1 Tax=Knipowitschia caucasica TaxID=637954 RepID=A0AAV2MBG3_KNICA
MCLGLAEMLAVVLSLKPWSYWILLQPFSTIKCPSNRPVLCLVLLRGLLWVVAEWACRGAQVGARLGRGGCQSF